VVAVLTLLPLLFDQLTLVLGTMLLVLMQKQGVGVVHNGMFNGAIVALKTGVSCCCCFLCCAVIGNFNEQQQNRKTQNLASNYCATDPLPLLNIPKKKPSEESKCRLLGWKC
jgi:hypothetical protein